MTCDQLAPYTTTVVTVAVAQLTFTNGLSTPVDIELSGAGLGSLLGGYTYEVFGARKLFAMCGAVSFCSMLLSLSVTVYRQATSKR